MFATAIRELLAADATLGAILTGQVWDRPLKRDGAGATPEAFAPTPPYQLRPNAVVVDNGGPADPAGPGDAFWQFVTVWLRAPATATGKAAISAAEERIVALLHGALLAGPHGTGAEVRFADRFGLVDDPDLDGVKLGYLRMQVSGLWGI